MMSFLCTPKFPKKSPRTYAILIAERELLREKSAYKKTRYYYVPVNHGTANRWACIQHG